MLDILLYPHEFLNKQVQPFDFNKPIKDPKELKKEMLESMYSQDGVGLSANQVGVDAQVFVMGSRNYPEASQIFINPQVVEASKETTLDWEGCLSFPGIFVKINRPSWIVAQFQDENGETKTGRIEGYDARCYLHELDHLVGITYKDRTSKLKWDMAVKRSTKFFKQRGLINA
jgi:peptide deformylase